MGDKTNSFGSVLIKFLQYAVEGATVGAAAWLIPKKTPSLDEVILIAVIAAAVFSTVDVLSMYFVDAKENNSNEWRKTLRQGTAFTIGSKLSGGLL